METITDPAPLVAPAAAPLTELVRDVTDKDLAAPTPCSDLDVRGLLHHLLLWGPALEAAGRKEVRPPSSETDLVTGDWAATLAEQTAALVAAWSDPTAWEGETRIAGPSAMPASMIGGMVVTELVVHGWDLARALGRSPSWDDAVLDFLHDQIVATAGMGREMGAYGPEHTVPAGAPKLDRVLGLTGRDPAWSPR